jgi:choline dehydrogenase-like flavoprotein
MGQGGVGLIVTEANTTITADVGLIGSGIASALMAARLAEVGIDVAILEAGPKVDRLDALLRYRDAPDKGIGSPYLQSPDYPYPRADAHQPWYIQSGPDHFKSGYLKAVGGTTWHWLGTTLRFLPDDFRMKSVFGIAQDWPLDYRTLEPWYQVAEEELAVAGDTDFDLGSPRSTAYPMPPIPLSSVDQAFIEALSGTEFEIAPTPQARLSRARDGRPACCGSASCIPICPVQAKYQATVHLEQASADGARIYAETTAVALEVGANQRIEAVRFKRPDGSKGRLKAKVFALGANAMEIPRLLLASRSEAQPGGVANSSDQVGRNLMDHPEQLTWALASDPVWPFRGPLSTAGIDAPRASEKRGDEAAFRIEISNAGWGWPTGAPFTTARELAKAGLRGEELAKEMKHHSARELLLSALIEQLPDPDNRVMLDSERFDRYGVPLPRIHYRIDDYVKRAQTRARGLHEEILERVGVTEIHHRDAFAGAGHIMGTARMGEDLKRSVVDPELRCHDHANLFLLGSAVFPTGAAANPTLTIAALSLRAVETVKKFLKT